MFLVDILVFILVLGLLVFFHEMGHFIAAKACGVYVDRFSLGMAPRLFGIRLGETDYCIGALPIGGYVKMAGQEDVPQDDETREEEYGDVPPERWLNHKPVWQRAIVFAAGPLMNVVLAVLLYAVLAGVGEYVPETKVDNRIGAIEPGSPAVTAPLYRVAGDVRPGQERVDYDHEPDTRGWKTGDRIASVDGEPIRSISDVVYAAIVGGEGVRNVIIERPGPDGSITRYISPVAPRMLSEDDKYPRFGVAPFQAALVDKLSEDMPALAAGLQSGDLITHVDGEPVDVVTFMERITAMTSGETAALTILRDEESLDIPVAPTIVGQLRGVLFSPPLHTTDEEERGQRPVVAAVQTFPAADGDEATENAGAEEDQDADGIASTGLKRGDEILEINGEPATVALLDERLRENPGASVSLKVRRPPIWGGLLRAESIETAELDIEPTGMVGLTWQTKMVYQRYSTLEILPEAFARSYQAIHRTLSVLGSLVTGGLSPSDLGGPVMIYRVTTEAARMGYSWLLEITAFISINLAIFNLLPLPVLDGGHLVGLAVEAVRRKPVNQRVAILVQQVGLVLILALFVFVTFNDIRTWILNIIP